MSSRPGRGEDKQSTVLRRSVIRHHEGMCLLPRQRGGQNRRVGRVAAINRWPKQTSSAGVQQVLRSLPVEVFGNGPKNTFWVHLEAGQMLAAVFDDELLRCFLAPASLKEGTRYLAPFRSGAW